LARAPDERQEQAKELFLQGMKLIDISKALEVPVGTIRSWKNRYNWDEKSNATLRKQRAVNRATKTPLETMAELPQKAIKTQSPRESLRLSFLIAWNPKKSNWPQRFQMTRSSFSSRRSSC